jgi:hypothetical protein
VITKRIVKLVVAVTTISLSLVALNAPTQAQTNTAPAEMKKARDFYLDATCGVYHREDYVWDPAITVAKMQGLGPSDGETLSSDLRQMMRQTSKFEQDKAKALLAYSWPNATISKAVTSLAQALLKDASNVAAIAKSNKWRLPERVPWWQSDDPARLALGISLEAPCPGWPALGEGGDSHRYISAVCPTRRTYDNYLKAKDKAIRQNMRVGDPIPKYLIDSMITSADYYERSGYILWDFGSRNTTVNTLARRLAEREYDDANETRAVAEGGKWREPRWVTDFEQFVTPLRRELGLPPAEPNGCPV